MWQVLIGLALVLISCIMIKAEQKPTMLYKRIVIALFFLGIINIVVGFILQEVYHGSKSGNLNK